MTETIQDKIKIVERNRIYKCVERLVLMACCSLVVCWSAFNSVLCYRNPLEMKCHLQWIEGAVSECWLTIIVLVFGFLFLLLLVSSTYRFFQKIWISFLCFLGLFVWGFYVYMDSGLCLDRYSHRFIFSVQEVVHAFFPSFGGLNGEYDNVLHVKRGGYLWFHLVCVYYVMMLMLSLFGRELINGMRRLTCSRKNKVVIWGYSEKGLLLALDFLCNKKCNRVVFYLDKDTVKEDDRKKIVDILDDHYCSWRDVSFANFAARIEAKRYFFIAESGRENILNAKRLIEVIKQRGKGRKINSLFATINNNKECDNDSDSERKRKISKQRDAKNRIKEIAGKGFSIDLHIRIENAEESVFYDWLDGDIRYLANIVLFKESSVSTSLLVNRLVADDFAFVIRKKQEQQYSNSFRLLLLGLGQNGQCALGEIVENVQRIDREIAVDVVEPDLNKWNLYRFQHNDFVKEYHVNHFGFDVQSSDFYDWLKEILPADDKCRLLKYDMVVMCLGDDSLALSTMAEIKKMYKNVKGSLPEKDKFYIQLDNYELAAFASGSEKMNLGFIPYGSLFDIYSCHLSENDVVERLARLINWIYWYGNSDFEAKNNNDIVSVVQCDALWNNETGFFDQQSSRASARGLVKRWKEMGYGIEFGRVRQENDIILSAQKEDCLAEEEHMRWMSFHYARGIRPWLLKVVDTEGNANVTDNLNIVGRVKKIKANQRSSFNAHAALVPFGELPFVDYALDVLANNRMSQDPFSVESINCYKGKGMVSKIRKNEFCMQANDYKINALLSNSEKLFEVGLVLKRLTGSARK